MAERVTIADHRMDVPARPVVVTLCGSSRFRADFERAKRELSLQRKIVIDLAGIYGHLEMMDMDGPVKEMLDELHLRRIDISDEIYVINPGNYIGTSTSREIAYAREHGKVVRYLVEPEGA